MNCCRLAHLMKSLGQSLALSSLLMYLWLIDLPGGAIAFAQSVPSAPEVTTLAASPDRLTVAALNVKNLDARDSDARFAAFGRLIVDNLKAPDIIALSEIQDNDGPIQSSVTAADKTYQDLIAAIVDEAGPPYEAIDIAPFNDTNGGQPGGNIRVGFLFNPRRVTLAPGRLGDAATAVQVADGPVLTVNPGSVEPDNPAFVNSRKPLVAQFIFNDESVFVVANHFASKRGGTASDRTRVRQAQAVHNLVAELLEEDPDANVIVAGDLNDFEDSPPLKVLAGNILQNLLNFLPRDDRFTFDFRGNLQVLDHILVSQNLLFDADAEFDIVHAVVGQRRSATDHDPVLARFTLPQLITDLPPIVEPEMEPEIEPEMTPEETGIFPDLAGAALASALKRDFAVRNSLGYRRARDYLYGQIDNKNGQVFGIYSSFAADIRPNINTSRADAYREGINAEHSWPRSHGTREGKANSDLHHLFPARERVNIIRSSSPFGEIPDVETDRWFFEDEELSFPPSRNIDAYSEAESSVFEPREAVKGDIARAQFYVYTVYRDQVSDRFFNEQRDTLCQWQAQDPVDQRERDRNAAIQRLQGNDNPFVLDASLGDRLYCSS